MAMDFFESQERARKRTGRLVVLFTLAVLGIIVSVYLVVAGVLAYAGMPEALGHPGVMAMIAAGTILVVGGGSLFKIVALKAGGGRSVAEHIGGKLLHPETSDLVEQRTLNVVEEMAIASGTPVPPVYMLGAENGINAFAAGYTPTDAVIGVTRGSVERLSRDEMQGVIAHEFSHILNGDMRLNIRLMGVLHGILIIGVIGYAILRSAFYTGGTYRSRRSGSDKGGGVAVVLALGAGLAVVGFVGTFFGNLIKAAVSRQREYLADASAVQFTRNPQGIAGALKKIGGLSHGASIRHPNGPQASHMYFGRGVTSGLSALFSTHPPLKDRIRRIDPSWDGDFVESVAEARPDSRAEAELRRLRSRGRVPQRVAAAMGLAGAAAMGTGGRGRTPVETPAKRPRPPGRAIDFIGRPSQAHLDLAAELMSAIPSQLIDAAREPYGARAVIHALLLHRDESVRQVQLERLRAASDEGVRAMVERLRPAAAALDARCRLPLVEIAIPALKELTRGQYETFRENLAALIRADRRVELFEWALERMVLRHLDRHFGRSEPPRASHHSLARLRRPCAVLLSTLAYAGHEAVDDARRAFDQAARHLESGALALLPFSETGSDELGRALDALEHVAARPKRQLVYACAESIATDREVTIDESELLRAICDSLDTPMPPLLPGMKLL